MPRFIKRTAVKAGMPPGALIHVGERRQDRVRITVMDYDRDRLAEHQPHDVETVFPLKDEPTTTWVNIDGIHDMGVIEKLGLHFLVHPLTLEDVVNSNQRPKVEDFEDYLLIVLKMLIQDTAREQVRAEQISLVVGPNFLISFQEVEGDVFEGVRARIRQGRARIRHSGPGYLAYALIDAIVDNYFVILEGLGEKIEVLEAALHEDTAENPLSRVYRLKQEMIYLRKQLWPLRETMSQLQKIETPLLGEANRVFFADVYDHLVQAIEIVESLREVLGSLHDLCISLTGQKMNETMKVLTIIATIFIPITFVAGIYGMNFTSMPELDWRWGYPLAWGLFVGIALGMIVYFRKKRWL